MTLPDGVGFASAGRFDGEGEEEDCLVGFHLQYQIKHTIVNVIIMTSDRDNPTTTEDVLIAKLDEASYEQEDETSPDNTVALQRVDLISEGIEAWAEQQCRSLLLELVADIIPKDSNDDIPKRQTLQQHLDLKIINLQLKTVDGEVIVKRHGENPPWPTHLQLDDVRGIKVVLDKHVDYPSYPASDVIIEENLQIPRVIVNRDTVVRCKLNIKRRSAQHEHRNYLRIKLAGLEHFIFPAFKGYVDDSTDGASCGCIGLLLQDVKTRHATLGEALCDPTYQVSSDPTTIQEMPSTERRAKWARHL